MINIIHNTPQTRVSTVSRVTTVFWVTIFVKVKGIGGARGVPGCLRMNPDDCVPLIMKLDPKTVWAPWDPLGSGGAGLEGGRRRVRP